MTQNLFTLIDKWNVSSPDVIKTTFVDPHLVLNDPDPKVWLKNNYPATSLNNHLFRNLRCNICQWILEDKTRDTVELDEEKVKAKSQIDIFNQIRSDEIEHIDQLLIANYFSDMSTDAPAFSETLGSVFDRMHILLIKKYKYGEIVHKGKEKEKTINSLAQERYALIDNQIESLKQAANHIIKSVTEHTMCFNQYKHFKMYNDSRFSSGFIRKKV